MKRQAGVAIVMAALLAGNVGVAQNIVDVAVKDARFSTLVRALQAAGLVDAVRDGKLTVFAPPNEAFEKLPAGVLADLLKPEGKDRLTAILLYHVVPGGGSSLSTLLGRGEVATLEGQDVSISFEGGRVRVNEAALQTADITCDNGVIHVIDSVLIPPEKGPANIVETAEAAGSFGTLLAAAKAAGLVEALSGDGPLTVFAPTDEAFAKLPKGTVESLLEPENKSKLAAILTYHVVAGAVTAGDALNAGEAKTLNGADVGITFEGGRIKIGEATLVRAGIEASNGLIHVIDGVLIPPKGESEAGSAEAIDMIQDAISRGVPAFNSGNAAGCADIYMDVSKTLLDGQSLPEAATHALSKAVRRAKHEHDAGRRAWILRHGLDDAMTALRCAM